LAVGEAFVCSFDACAATAMRSVAESLLISTASSPALSFAVGELVANGFDVRVYEIMRNGIGAHARVTGQP